MKVHISEEKLVIADRFLGPNAKKASGLKHAYLIHLPLMFLSSITAAKVV